jgi:hypothetical protein
MTLIIMAASRIQGITRDGLTYVDDNGTAQFIDFEACFNLYFANFVKPDNLQHIKEINHMTDEKLTQSIEKRRKWKEVALRNIIGNPPYIEFHTDPPIRFTFEDENNYRKIRTAIEENGWRTFDLS